MFTDVKMLFTVVNTFLSLVIDLPFFSTECRSGETRREREEKTEKEESHKN